MVKRRIIQVMTALIYNANIPGFFKGTIFKGDLKGICVPGLNCYSCPGAIGSCPLGTLQNSMMSFPDKAMFYIIGTLLLFGTLFGRLICGFLCPFGLLQDLLYKIPTPKLHKGKVTRGLSYLKYLILLAFVIVLPAALTSPAFCKYICPAGTLEAGIPLVAMNGSLREIIGVLFNWKVAVLIVILLGMVFIERAFCRFLCPLGAIYSLFNKISLFGIKTDERSCTNCNRCVNVCGLDIRKPGDHECISCGKCISVCPENAISWKSIINLKRKGEKK